MKKPNWKADSFLRTGLRHAQRSQPCQDHVVLEGGRGAALSDGVSRSKDSEKASVCSTQSALEVMRNAARDKALLNDLMSSSEASKRALSYIAQQITATISERLREYPGSDATLTFVYLLNERYAVIGYIGDSAVIVISDGKADVYTQTRDYGGPTESVTNQKAAELMDVRVIDMEKENVRAFLLVSDGLEEELYTKGARCRAMKECENYVNALFRPDGHDAIEKMLDTVTSNGVFDDDISLAVLARDTVSLPEEPKWLCSCGHRNYLTATFCERCDKDYFTLYRHADMSRFPTPWEYFSYLNAHPDEERRIIGLTAPAPDASAFGSSDVAESSKGSDSSREKTDSSRSGTSHAHTARPRSVHTSKHGQKKGHGMMSIPKRVAVIGSAVAVLLCGALIVNFFQMLSISHTLTAMQAEIDSLKGGAVASETATQTPATSDEASPAIITAHSKSTPVSRSSTVSTETALRQPATVSPTAASETTASDSAASSASSSASSPDTTAVTVSVPTALYREPNYQEEEIGYAIQDDNAIALLSTETVDGIKWAKVKTSAGIIGWAPEDLFKAKE